MSVDSLYGFIGGRYIVNPTTVVHIGKISGVCAANIKLISGGTLEVNSGNQQLGLSLQAGPMIGFTLVSGGGTFLNTLGPTFGNGYHLDTGEIFCVNLAGSIYLYASGATCTFEIAFGRSQGFGGL